MMIGNAFPIKNKYLLKDWEIKTIQTIDFLNVVGDFNVLVALTVLNFIGFSEINIHFFIVLFLSLLVYIANRKGRYIVGAYIFFAIGNYLLSMTVLLMGLQTYSLMYFFPITLSVIHIFGRRETFFHLLTWLIIYFLNVVLLLFFAHHYQSISLSPSLLEMVIIFNVLLAFFCGVTIITLISWNTITLEESIRKKSTEKELLLAELFHRVKNNLNLVTSLLNIRKNKSNSPEVSEALEDCRNRVFSMALVHDRLYNENNIGKLNLNEFIDDLVNSIELNFGEGAEINIQIPETIHLSVSKSVPTGLILNELFTNVYKHAKSPDRVLKVVLDIVVNGKELSITVSDNGAGIKENSSREGNLGLELIQSLTEQLDGKFQLRNKEDGSGASAVLQFSF